MPGKQDALAKMHKQELMRLTRGVVAFIAGLQQNDGSFAGDHWGEAHCRVSAYSLT